MFNKYKQVIKLLNSSLFTSASCTHISINSQTYEEYVSLSKLFNNPWNEFIIFPSWRLYKFLPLKNIYSPKHKGYGLEFDKCCICKKIIGTSNYISLSHFGGVCVECNKEHGLYISRAGYNALRFLNNTPMDKIYRLNVNKEIKKQIEKVTTFIINSNYSRKPKSLEMLNYIKE